MLLGTIDEEDLDGGWTLVLTDSWSWTRTPGGAPF